MEQQKEEMKRAEEQQEALRIQREKQRAWKAKRDQALKEKKEKEEQESIRLAWEEQVKKQEKVAKPCISLTELQERDAKILAKRQAMLAQKAKSSRIEKLNAIQTKVICIHVENTRGKGPSTTPSTNSSFPTLSNSHS